MGAGSWIVFHTAKKKLLNGTIDLDTDQLKMALLRSAAVLSAGSGSVWAQIVANEISLTGGYATQGKSLTGCSVTNSGGTTKFSHGNRVFTANGAHLGAIKYAVIVDTGKAGSPLVCFARLSTNAFSVGAGNTLAISANASGVFDVTGATA